MIEATRPSPCGSGAQPAANADCSEATSSDPTSSIRVHPDAICDAGRCAILDIDFMTGSMLNPVCEHAG
jgi:hypothetical protein